MQKRGRRAHYSKKNGPHLGIDFDNIQTKIQVHFFNFITCILNDALHTIFKNAKLNLKNDDCNLKKNSDKYFKCLNLCLLNKFKNEYFLGYTLFFNKNYLKLFSYYYNSGRLILHKKKYFEDKENIISKKTKSFYHLRKECISKKIFK